MDLGGGGEITMVMVKDMVDGRLWWGESNVRERGRKMDLL